jgi:hypothetical protein
MYYLLLEVSFPSPESKFLVMQEVFFKLPKPLGDIQAKPESFYRGV